MISKGKENKVRSRGPSTGSQALRSRSNLSHLNNKILKLPIVTSQSWGIMDAKTGDLLWSKDCNQQREMASLTKIMTGYISCILIQQTQLDWEKYNFMVTQRASTIKGTSAMLRVNEIVSIKDLLHGLMLPSGNDAALTLAIGFGRVLLSEKEKIENENKSEYDVTRICVNRFVKEMNKCAYKLALRDTKFLNPHGLSEKGNKSTAEDLCKLAFHAMANGSQRTVTWINTNKLLAKEGFTGIKTGLTPNAGPCLCIHYTKDGFHLIITLLCCKDGDYRFHEALKLANFALTNLKHAQQVLVDNRSELKTRFLARICSTDIRQLQ